MATLARSIARAGYKITKILLLKSCRSFRILPNWRNFAKHGNTALDQGWLFRGKKGKKPFKWSHTQTDFCAE